MASTSATILYESKHAAVTRPGLRALVPYWSGQRSGYSGASTHHPAFTTRQALSRTTPSVFIYAC